MTFRNTARPVRLLAALLVLMCLMMSSALPGAGPSLADAHKVSCKGKQKKAKAACVKRASLHRRVHAMATLARVRAVTRSTRCTTKRGKCVSRPAPAPAHAPTPTPAPTSAASGPATVKPVGFTVLSDADAAARVRRSSFEPRPGNSLFNRTMPTDLQLQSYRANVDFAFGKLVSGRFTGTTDEIIQWAAHKWGLDEDHLRAIAVVESWWNQSVWSDGTIQGVDINGNPQTHAGGGSIISVTSAHTAAFNSRLPRLSTAFALDYLGAVIRANYDGHTTWLNDVERGKTYASGDMWGSIAVWYSGRWYANGSHEYISRVQGELATRTWKKPGF